MRRPRALGRTLREAAALATQARFLSRDLRRTSRKGRGPTVVLLHGLYASAGVFRPMRKRMEQVLDASSHSLSYVPGPGIEELSERVRKLIENVEAPAEIHLVGHSLGGLVMRHYASSPKCDPRVVQTISLAAPFLGSSKNWLVPGQAGRDIAPGAPLLAQLRDSREQNRRIPHVTLVAEEDELILPGAYPDYGDHALITRAGHNGILFSDEAINRVVQAIDRCSGRA